MATFDSWPFPAAAGETLHGAVGEFGQPRSVVDVSNVLVIDNGANVTKVGLANQEEPFMVPNFYVKSKKEKTKFTGLFARDVLWDISGLYYQRPFVKGYPCNWELQEELWTNMFENDVHIDPAGKDVILTMPVFAPSPLIHSALEVVFETLNAESLFCAPPPLFSAFGHQRKVGRKERRLSSLGVSEVKGGRKPAQLIVDSGYSFSHVVPVVGGSVAHAGVRRVGVGGKVLTNLLKETISFRAWDMMEETFLMNIVKERTCYVSNCFLKDMEQTKKPNNLITRYYALPNYTSPDRGHVLSAEEAEEHINPSASGTDAAVADAIVRARAEGKAEESGDDVQILVLNNERLAVPEVLFRPSDAGIMQMGIGEAILHSIESIPDPSVRPLLLGNIVLTGGSANLPGFAERVYAEVRERTDSNLDVNVYIDSRPDQYAWFGACSFASTMKYVSGRPSKTLYLEEGKHACSERFAPYFTS